MNRKDLTRRGKFLLFLKQWPSNWEMSDFVVDGVTYNCVEQYMMAEKARTFGDDGALKEVMGAAHPRDQKSAGRAVRGYVEETWSKARYSVVLTATVEKYRQNEGLRARLLATQDDETFVEAAPYDTVWGIGLAADHPDAGDPQKWRGQNLLGRAITEARSAVRAEFG